MILGSPHRAYRIEQAGRQQYVLQVGDRWHRLDGDLFDGYRAGPTVNPAGLRTLPPVAPSKIVAIGLNYRDHAREMNKPLPDTPQIFLKPPSAVVGSGDTIVMPPEAERVDYEGELGVVIGARAHRVVAAEAEDYILGLTCVNDVTARDLQKRDVQYTRAKGFDTFAPIGPCIAIGIASSALDVETWVNGERRQASNTRELIFGVGHLVEFVSSVMTLLPGDVIATSTPSGVGPLAPGDRVVVKVAGVGELENGVTRRDQVSGETP